MDNIKDAFTFLFKEKNWFLKILVPFIFMILIVLPSILSSGTLRSTNLTDYSIYNSYAYSSVNILNMFLSCLICFIIIPFLGIVGWYTYESTQSGIQKRATKALWHGDIGDKLKKASKYITASLIYGLGIGVIYTVLFLIFVTIIIILTGGDMSFTDGIMVGREGLGIIYLLAICAISCVFFFVILTISIITFMIYMPALLRLIATNTFADAFKIQENWNIAMRYKGQFLSIYLLNFVMGIVLVVISFGVGIAGAMFLFSAPLITLCINFVGYFGYMIIATHYAYFVYPRFAGLVYREVIQSETSLSYVSLEESKK